MDLQDLIQRFCVVYRMRNLHIHSIGLNFGPVREFQKLLLFHRLIWLLPVAVPSQSLQTREDPEPFLNTFTLSWHLLKAPKNLT